MTVEHTRVWLVTDRAGFEPLWGAALDRASLPARAASPTTVVDRIQAGQALVADAASTSLDEDELLATLGFARASGVVAAVDLGERAAPPWLVELLEDLCVGLVARGAQDVEGVVARMARRLDPSRGRRFEYLTVPPRGDGLLAVWGDGRAAILPRPLAAGDDPGVEVVDIRLSDDAAHAEVELAAGRVLTLDASDAPRPAPAAMAEPTPDVGARLRELRLAAGLTQAEVARRTGIHRPNVARVETGRHTPSLDTLRRIAEAIGVAPGDVLRGG